MYLVIVHTLIIFSLLCQSTSLVTSRSIRHCPPNIYTLEVKSQYICLNRHSVQCTHSNIVFTVPEYVHSYHLCPCSTFIELARQSSNCFHKNRREQIKNCIDRRNNDIDHYVYEASNIHMNVSLVRNYMTTLMKIPKSATEMMKRILDLSTSAQKVRKALIENVGKDEVMSQYPYIFALLSKIGLLHYNKSILPRLKQLEKVMQNTMPGIKELVYFNTILYLKLENSDVMEYCLQRSLDGCTQMLSGMPKNIFTEKNIKFVDKSRVPLYQKRYRGGRPVYELCNSNKCTVKRIASFFKASSKCIDFPVERQRFVYENVLGNGIDFRHQLDKCTRACDIVGQCPDDCEVKPSVELTNLIMHVSNKVYSDDQLKLKLAHMKSILLECIKKSDEGLSDRIADSGEEGSGYWIDDTEDSERPYIKPKDHRRELESVQSSTVRVNSLSHPSSPVSRQLTGSNTLTNFNSHYYYLPRSIKDNLHGTFNITSELMLLMATLEDTHGNCLSNGVHHAQLEVMLKNGTSAQLPVVAYIDNRGTFTSSGIDEDIQQMYCRSQAEIELCSRIHQAMQAKHRQRDTLGQMNLSNYDSSAQREQEYVSSSPTWRVDDILANNDSGTVYVDQQLYLTLEQQNKISGQIKEYTERGVFENYLSSIENEITFEPYIEDPNCLNPWTQISSFRSRLSTRVCPQQIKSHVCYSFIQLAQVNDSPIVGRLPIKHVLKSNSIVVGIHQSQLFSAIFQVDNIQISLLDAMEYVFQVVTSYADLNIYMVDAQTAAKNLIPIQLIIALGRLEDTVYGYFDTRGYILINPTNLDLEKFCTVALHEFMHFLGFDHSNIIHSVMFSYTDLFMPQLLYTTDVFNLASIYHIPQYYKKKISDEPFHEYAINSALSIIYHRTRRSPSQSRSYGSHHRMLQFLRNNHTFYRYSSRYTIPMYGKPHNALPQYLVNGIRFNRTLMNIPEKILMGKS